MHHRQALQPIAVADRILQRRQFTRLFAVKFQSSKFLQRPRFSNWFFVSICRAFRKRSPGDGEDGFIIQVEDSECKPSYAAGDLNHTLFVENRGYDVLKPLETAFKPNGDRIELLKVNNNENEAYLMEDGMLRNSDLLNFAIQIASGMVITVFLCE